MKVPGGEVLGPFWDRSEWLEARKAGIGGSDIGTIMGLSSFTSDLEVYDSKQADAPEREASEQMAIGRAIEGFILGMWTDRYKPAGLIDANDYLIRSTGTPYLLHSPDAMLVDDDGMALAGIEIKNTRSDTNWDPLPPMYMAQVQHGLLCTGLEHWTVVALVAGQRLKVVEVDADKEFQGRILVAAERFWRDHVQKNVPPAPDGSESSSRALQSRWEPSQGESAEVPGLLWDQFKHCSLMFDEWKASREVALQRIQAAMGEAEIAMVDGTQVATWKLQTRKSVDVTRLRQEDPELAKKFEKVSSSRVFRPKT